MLRVGLTGGIGAGKSTVASRLAEHGAVLIDADRIAREVVEPGTEGLAEVVTAFGPSILGPDGALDRAALAARVFGNPAELATLNGIVHPRVGARSAELMAGAGDDAVIVHDVPLLVENGMAPAYHLVIIVDAPVETRVRRLVSARNMPEADARARIAAQATEADRRAVADVWLDNGGTPDRVVAEVDALWADRLVPYESNVRLGRRTQRGAPKLVPADPTWPDQAQRLINRLRLAGGRRIQRIDHIGSTSIPGLAAKDVIDVQITVGSLADADALAEPLGAAGFPVLPHVIQDDPKPPGSDPEPWVKRFHVAADPGRWANLHLRVAGSPGWRFALLFPAWLRADDAVRADYQKFKDTVAATTRTTEDYATAKEPWFREAYPRALDWANHTGWSP